MEDEGHSVLKYKNKLFKFNINEEDYGDDECWCGSGYYPTGENVFYYHWDCHIRRHDLPGKYIGTVIDPNRLNKKKLRRLLESNPLEAWFGGKPSKGVKAN